MAFLGKQFNRDELPQSDRSFDLLPNGWYDATITKTELKDTKNGTGSILNIRFDILGPTHQGRVIFKGINIRNQSENAERIGLQELNELMAAVGLKVVQDSDELHGKSCQIKIKTKPADGQYEAKNEISGFKSLNGSAMPAPSMPAMGSTIPPMQRAETVAQPAQVEASPRSATPPWFKPQA